MLGQFHRRKFNSTKNTKACLQTAVFTKYQKWMFSDKNEKKITSSGENETFGNLIKLGIIGIRLYFKWIYRFENIEIWPS